MNTVQLLAMTLLFTAVMFVPQKAENMEAYKEPANRQRLDTIESGIVLPELPNRAAINEEIEKARQKQEELLQKLHSVADNHSIAPVNARLDKVWKAIPGHNGQELDIERSLQLNLEQPFADKLRLVMKEIAPEIGLEQLGSHPIYRGNPDKPMVSLMINVAWGNEYLSTMLDVLETEKVQATFFFDGSWLSKNISTAQLIKEKGHELSNHAYSHKNMSRLSYEDHYSEIARTEALLEHELGVKNSLFAPPSGDYNQLTVDTASELGLKTILWTLDTVDWRNPEPSAIINKISAQVGPGSLILMHPTSSSSEALQQIIQAVKGKGLVLGTVSGLISSDRMPYVESAE